MIEAEGAEITRLIVASQRPEVRYEDAEPDDKDGETTLAGWSAAVESLLRHWM